MAEVWGTMRHDEKVYGDVRCSNGEVFLEDFFTHIAREMHRKRYREERNHPEWVDLGGEA